MEGIKRRFNMLSHNQNINDLLDKIFELKELLVHGLSPAKGGEDDADRLADENLLARYNRETNSIPEIQQLSSSLKINDELDQEFRNALARYLKVSFAEGLERPRNDKDKAPLQTFLSNHVEYLSALQSILDQDEQMQKLREENNNFKLYLKEGEAAGKFKQFPKTISDSEGLEIRRQQLETKHNRMRADPSLQFGNQARVINIDELNKKKLQFLNSEEIKQEQEKFQHSVNDKKNTPSYKENQAAQQRAMKIIEAAKELHANKSALENKFNTLMSELNSPNSTEDTILQNLINWEKTALSYIENKTSSAASDLFRFIGKKIGGGKMIDPEDNKALKIELTEIIKQCIILSQMCTFRENISALDQHTKNFVRNHNPAHLEEGTVSKQFKQVSDKITEVAEKRFGYVKPLAAAPHN
jgi:hypothetical protein